MAVAAAIIGSSVLGTAGSLISAGKASSAAKQGAAQAADATVQSTQLQIAEAQRQFNAQLGLLAPLILNQYGAQSMYAKMLGFDQMSPSTLSQITGGQAGSGGSAGAAAPFSPGGQTPSLPQSFASPGSYSPNLGYTSPAAAADAGNYLSFGRPQQSLYAQAPALSAPARGGGGSPANSLYAQSPGLQPAPYGQTGAGFFDPNVNPSRLGAPGVMGTEMGQHAFNNTLAAPTLGSDPFVGRVMSTPTFGGYANDPAVMAAQGNRTAAGTPYADPYFRNVLAGPFGQGDALVNNARNSRLAAEGGFANDPRFQFAQNTQVVGDQFETSPGYNFAVEQAQRAGERALSRGGGASGGGRIAQELSRRVQGEAQREYYNWAAARRADLSRQDAAAAAYQGLQAADVSRMDAALLNNLNRQDTAMANWLGRGVLDVNRMDQAIAAARQAQMFDLSRGDQAYQNYFSRLAGDVTRQAQAIQNNQSLNQFDLGRQDQQYNNYLNFLAAASGFGNPTGAAVSAAGQQGAQITNAYGNQGNALANIYGGLGENRANIALGTGANVNNQLQSGIGNYLFYRALG